MEREHIKCLIIGSGPAGYTAAIYAARADMNPVIYTGLKMGGQLMDTTEVDNFPGYPDGIKGPQMMEDMKKQCERFGTEVRFGLATKVHFDETPKRIEIDSTKEVTADTVIIATGASAKWLGLESEERLSLVEFLLVRFVMDSFTKEKKLQLLGLEIQHVKKLLI